MDTEVAEKALSDAKLKQAPADAVADKAAADAKLVAEKAATAADAKVEEAKVAVGGKGKSKRVRFSKKIKGGKNKKRVKTNKKRR